MKTKNSNSDIITLVAAILDKLGPFPKNTPRKDKWRTTEQLAHEIFVKMERRISLEELERVLHQYEAAYRKRMEKGLPPDALIRRAKYPDRTTVLPLWGSTKWHGQPWPEQPTFQRSDPPEDIPASLKVPEDAPRVFLSHTHQDSALAYQVAETLADMGVGSWMYETEIDFGEDISKSVRSELAKCATCLALVTRDSIASLWVLTELHTVLEIGKPVILVINTNDALLLDLFRSVGFMQPDEPYDFSVQFDPDLICTLKNDYIHRQSETRAGRYGKQVRDFLATLPSYLRGQPALAFPSLPADRLGSIPLRPFQSLPGRLKDAAN